MTRLSTRVEAVRIPVIGGISLAADHYQPQTDERCPTIVIRTPYGRNWRHGYFGMVVGFLARWMAAHGYHVIVQDVRGRFDSEGTFEPYMHEREDGLALLDWLRAQSWFNGVVGMWGSSYLGIVQWAIADAPEIKALMPLITSSRLYEIVFPDGVLDFGLLLRWMAILDTGETRRARSLLTGGGLLLEVQWQVRRAMQQPHPLESANRYSAHFADLFREWITADADAPIWQKVNSAIPMCDVNAPVHLVGGWFDFFLRGMLQDYADLVAAGKSPHLTIGGWGHFSHLFLMLNTPKTALAWFDTHLKGKPAPAAPPVRLYVMGEEKWRSFDQYPPASKTTPFYLNSGGQLSAHAVTGAPDSFCYDPQHPTPIIGGTQFSPDAGRRSSRQLVRRADVLVYTSAPLREPLTVIGQVALDLTVSADGGADFWARLCDLTPNGRLITVCDGLYHLKPDQCSGSPQRITVDLWATAYQFKTGHALVILVSGGAHPRWLRNSGGENPLTDAVLKPVHHTLYYDLDFPNTLRLPVIPHAN